MCIKHPRSGSRLQIYTESTQDKHKVQDNEPGCTVGPQFQHCCENIIGAEARRQLKQRLKHQREVRIGETETILFLFRQSRSRIRSDLSSWVLLELVLSVLYAERLRSWARFPPPLGPGPDSLSHCSAVVQGSSAGQGRAAELCPQQAAFSTVASSKWIFI
ncbi:hypothetical protein ONS95_000867 [Cadophora gregata]|uniref:uncharacterized protein n=1 Tax=Cadophora gregata TaxID=51156 RepID=UPI0026DBF10D|nr:uncharacterized protein ONS95_000867 [Cadophora gregata]KAK0128923.1 hypothetical protein ONS95_000867 [Cadophora gregata]